MGCSGQDGMWELWAKGSNLGGRTENLKKTQPPDLLTVLTILTFLLLIFHTLPQGINFLFARICLAEVKWAWSYLDSQTGTIFLQTDRKSSLLHNVSNFALLTYLLHGAESFLRSSLVCSQSRNSPNFTEPEGSLPHSQASATCLYPGPAQSLLFKF